MRRYIIILLWFAGLTSLTLPAAAQRGVTYNADERKPIAPHRVAGAELYSKNKGLLLPKISYVTRIGLELTADDMGLTVYQTDSVKGLYEFDGLAWRCLNPLEIIDDSGMVRQLHKVALSGKYLDLSDRPNIPQSINDLSEVAFSGNYADLKDKPNIPALPDEGEAQSFAKVALSGDYLDLVNRPRIPQSINDLSAAAFSGDYADLETKLPLPTALGDLEADEDHQTVEEDDAALWDALAQMSVPKKLSDLETDYNTNLVTEKEIQTWNGIEHRDIPRRISEFTQNEFYRSVSADDKARWNEAAAKPYPTMLRDLEQDSNHLIVTEKEKAEWDAAAERLSFSGRYEDIPDRPQLHSVALTGSYGSLSTKMPIPTDLSDFERNEYYSLVTLSEWEAWNRKSEFKGSYKDLIDTPRIATRIADLKADYEAMTVSNNDKNHWNNMAAVMDSSGWFSGNYNDLKDKPKIPSVLSDLLQDTAAMTVSATYAPLGERQTWDAMTELHNSIGLFVSDYESDALHMTVSYADTLNWNADARRVIPDSLRHLELEDGTQWATDSLKEAWNKLLSAYIISDDTIAALQELSSTINSHSTAWFAGAETLKSTLERYTSLKSKLLPIAYSGDYNDLTDTPAQITLMDSATLAPLSHLAKVATSGNYYDLSGRPELATVATDASYVWLTDIPETAKVATSGDYDDLTNLPTTTSGDLTGGFAKDRSGNRTGFTLKNSPTFGGATAVNGNLTVGTAEDANPDLGDKTAKKIESRYNIKVGTNVNTTVNPTLVTNYLSSVTTEKVLNDQWLKEAKTYANEAVLPEGMVLMWYGNANEIPKCWKRYNGMNGRFPVCVNNGENGYEAKETDSLSIYQPRATAGEEAHLLTIDEMPSHSHPIKYEHVGRRDGAKGALDDTMEGNAYDRSLKTSVEGGDAPHENRPPFCAIYFIIRDNATCPN